MVKAIAILRCPFDLIVTVTIWALCVIDEWLDNALP